ncbi:MAG: hypothetical protein HC833_24500 [Leptolyngbyaceae cyanobacterium RM1_406_9]|nr:hypothetical protein [Leptolyngbyaceae cyanobacterium RM1_406_9]
MENEDTIKGYSLIHWGQNIVFCPLFFAIELSFNTSDRKLVSSIQVDVEPILLLEDIQRGSLIAWIRSTFKLSKDAPNLGLDPNRLEEYLDQSKFALVDFTRNRTTLTDAGLTELQMKILEIVSEKQPTPELPIHTPVPKKDLLFGIQKIQSAVSHLTNDGDSAGYIGGDSSKVPFNLTLNITPGTIEDILTKETLTNEVRMLLKVKKPDYLGSSQWEFKDGKSTIDVKINDFEWLEKFRKREFVLAPGDSLLAMVEVTSRYDIDNNLISTRHTLMKVLELRTVNSSKEFKQGELDSSEE